jgi:hypothetical protein
VAAGIGIVNPDAWRGLARTSRVEVAIAAVTMAGVIGVGVLEALLVAVALSIVDVVRRSAIPHDAVLGWDERMGRYATPWRTPASSSWSAATTSTPPCGPPWRSRPPPGQVHPPRVMAGHPRRRDPERMGAARYAFRVRGWASDEVLAALREELEVEVVPEPDRSSTAIQGWLPDQAALYGVLARIRQLGLELLEVRRLPRSG